MSAIVVTSPLKTQEGGEVSILSSPVPEVYWIAYYDLPQEAWSVALIDKFGYQLDESYEVIVGQAEPFVENVGLEGIAYLGVCGDGSVVAQTYLEAGDSPLDKIKVTYSTVTYPDGSIKVINAVAELLP